MKEVQEFVGSINHCLNSIQGRTNGLLALKTLLGQCSSDFFGSNVGPFINTIVYQILGKPDRLTSKDVSLIGPILRSIFHQGPGFPDVAKPRGLRPQQVDHGQARIQTIKRDQVSEKFILF